MPTPTHLVQRGKRYGLRRKIPSNVTHLVKQNPDLWKALTGYGGARKEDWHLLIRTKGKLKQQF